MREWWVIICWKISPRYRLNARMRASSAIAIRWWKKAPWWWRSANPAKPPTRWQRCAKRKKKVHLAIGIINVVGSTIARETDGGIYLHAGPEIGVASTKAFTCQLAVLTMLALYIGRRKFMSQAQCQEIIDGLCSIPEQMETVLKQSEVVKDIVTQFCDRENWLFLGRGYHYPIALEGALKLKEISYIHAEGMPAAEMKHGPIALINEGMPVVFVATRGVQYEKVISNIEEVARPRRPGDRRRHRRRHQHQPVQRSCGVRAQHDRMPATAAERGAIAIAGVSRRGGARLQRG